MPSNLPARWLSPVTRELDTQTDCAAAALGKTQRRKECAARAGGYALASIALLLASLFCAAAGAQEQVPSPAPQQAPPGLPGAVSVEKQTPQGLITCLQPPPMVGWQDYEGPYAKVVAVFARRLERNEVAIGTRNYKPGTKLCTLETKDKFFLFLDNTIDPLTFLSAAFNAGISQAENTDPSYGQGAAGYGKRVGFNLIDQAQADFFLDFAYPTIFSEDPRYYRLGTGPFKRRFFHAVKHAAVAYDENGRQMPNYSLWFGTTSAIALSNVYHPDHQRGFAPTAEGVGSSVAQGIGYDELREFWPEIAHKFKLPFRGEAAGQNQSTNTANP